MRATNQFGFGAGDGLIVEPSQRAAHFIERRTALGKICLQTHVAEFFGTIGTREPASCIFVTFRFDQEDAGNGGVVINHSITFTAGMGTTNLPP